MAGRVPCKPVAVGDHSEPLPKGLGEGNSLGGLYLGRSGHFSGFLDVFGRFGLLAAALSWGCLPVPQRSGDPERLGPELAFRLQPVALRIAPMPQGAAVLTDEIRPDRNVFHGKRHVQAGVSLLHRWRRSLRLCGGTFAARCLFGWFQRAFGRRLGSGRFADALGFDFPWGGGF